MWIGGAQFAYVTTTSERGAREANGKQHVRDPNESANEEERTPEEPRQCLSLSQRFGPYADVVWGFK